MRLIDADELKEKLTVVLNKMTEYDGELETCVDFALKKLEAEPTIEAEPIRHGSWVEDKYGFNACSECGYEWDIPEYNEAKYCPQCGAKINLEEQQ